MKVRKCINKTGVHVPKTKVTLQLWEDFLDSKPRRMTISDALIYLIKEHLKQGKEIPKDFNSSTLK